MGLQLLDLLRHGTDLVLLRVGQVVVHQVGPAGLDPGASDDPPGDSDHCAVVRDVAEDDGAGSDAHVVADGDVPEDGCVASDDDVVADRGVPLALVERHASEGDALVDADVFAYLGGLADDHADGMVDEEPLADLRRGVDVASSKVDRPEVQLPGLVELPCLPQLVGLPVEADRVEAGVVPNGVILVNNGRILLHHRCQVVGVDHHGPCIPSL